uniref:Uncharacterized protein n=1 Tax=Romanomermis culicivorax TaxID=13658 RepID=A0A915LAU5_ROMCU
SGTFEKTGRSRGDGTFEVRDFRGNGTQPTSVVPFVISINFQENVGKIFSGLFVNINDMEDKEYTIPTALLPDNWIAVGEDMKTRCEKNISVDKTFPIATFTWVKMPNPSDNFYQFYDGGHSAIFLGCMKKGGIYVYFNKSLIEVITQEK